MSSRLEMCLLFFFFSGSCMYIYVHIIKHVVSSRKKNVR
jgi:hypothetical protein